MGTSGSGNEIPISRPLPLWIELPGDVTANILGRLGAEEILKSAQGVCNTWKKVCLYPATWRVVHLKNQWGNDCRNFDLMCRCAVDRSKGQLVDLSIAYFGADDLLSYVAHRSSHLQCLTLAITRDISASALIEAVKKLPQLEELHLISIMPLDAKDVESIGISCPLLNSFTYTVKWGFEYEHNGIALAIALAMPNLQHLQLGGGVMTNEGLEEILDGFPHLESLHLLDCYGLHLTGALMERCSKQIKFRRLPVEP